MKRNLRLHKAAKHEDIKYSCGDCDCHATSARCKLFLTQGWRLVVRGGLCLYDGCIVSKQEPFIYTGANFLERGHSFNERVQK